jgi:hypothetical protein
MVRTGDVWVCRTDGRKRPWQVIEVSGTVVSLQATEGRHPVITMAVTELEQEWEKLQTSEEEREQALSRGIHMAMTMALREIPRGDLTDDAYYAQLTERLRMRLRGVPMPEWMQPEFWSVEADNMLPGMRAHRVTPTVLVGKPVAMIVDKDPIPVYTALLGDLFIKSGNPVMALAGLARVVMAKEKPDGAS